MPDLPDDTLIAQFDDGTKLTMGEFRRIYAALPPQNQQMALRDRRTFIQQWSLLRKLSIMAEKDKLDQESPTRESLEFDRMNILATAKLNDVLKTATVDPGELVKYYDVNKEKYKSVRVKAIYISYTDDAEVAKSKHLMTEDQAKAKATALLAKIRGGADFVQLVKENSDDETSKAKDGDFITLRSSDNVPEAVRNAVFGLKKGDTSEPVKQQSGYYLFRAEEITYRPLSQVRDEIFSDLKRQHYSDWLEQTNRDNKVQFTSPQFLGLTPLAVQPAK